MMTFQSRFGRAEWLKPYTADDGAATGRRAASSASPSSRRASPPTAWRRWRRSRVENAGYFREAGGENFAAIPCLNDSAEGMAVIEAVARRELKGWRE